MVWLHVKVYLIAWASLYINTFTKFFSLFYFYFYPNHKLMVVSNTRVNYEVPHICGTIFFLSWFLDGVQTVF